MSDALSSWSRRRAAVAAEAAAEEAAVQDAALAAEQAALAEKTDEEILQALGLPDPDTLVQGDDFKAFMAKAVPAHLRKRALRKLWVSNPVLACVDGLNDYDDDYLTQSLGQGPIKTTYQVGKGMLAHLLALEKTQKPNDDPMEEACADAPMPPEPEEPEQIADTREDETPEPPVLAPRRMQFQFQEVTA